MSFGNIVQVLEYCFKKKLFYLLFLCGYLEFSESYQSFCKENTLQL